MAHRRLWQAAWRATPDQPEDRGPVGVRPPGAGRPTPRRTGRPRSPSARASGLIAPLAGPEGGIRRHRRKLEPPDTCTRGPPQAIPPVITCATSDGREGWRANRSFRRPSTSQLSSVGLGVLAFGLGSRGTSSRGARRCRGRFPLTPLSSSRSATAPRSSGAFSDNAATERGCCAGSAF